jgi:hypothetical protein
MRVFKSKRFAKFADKEGITNTKLCNAVRDAEQGAIDADYGGGVIKQRIARQGAGKSGGYRTIILFRAGELSFFVYGFAKSDRSNITNSDKDDFKELARVLLAASDSNLVDLVERNEFLEVTYHEEDQDIQE